LRRPNRGGIVALVAVVALIVLLTSLRGIAGFYTDYLWFHSLNLAGVWKTIVGSKMVLTLIFLAIFFILQFTNLLIADRLAPAFRPPGPEEELRERYHAIIGHRAGLVRWSISGLFALIAASGVSSQWNEWILFTHSQKFNIVDEQFHKDVGFYVFRLPFLSFVVNWTFAAVVTIFIVTATMHFLNGGIRSRTANDSQRVTPQVKAHLSLLLGVLALIKAADYWLGRYELTGSTRGFVDGAGYTDVKAQLPAISLLMVISLFSFVLLVVNIWRRGWVFPVVTVGLWALVAIVAGTIYPAFIQRFRVDPAESQREQVYIERNIRATREAFNIEPNQDIEISEFPYESQITANDIRANADLLTQARLLDPLEVHNTFQSLQGLKSIYRFPGDSLDVDQYLIDDELTQVLIGARVLDVSREASFEKKHVSNTHGYGVAISYANKVNAQGLPEFLVQGVPAEPAQEFVDPLDKQQIYYGERLGGYAITGATRPEVDYLDKNNQEVTVFNKDVGGVKMGSIFRRAMFALRFGQIDPLISSYITSNSRVLYIRDIRERVEKIAPFIRWDSDPYPVLSGGHVVYMIDGYTTSNHYPNSQRADTTSVPDGSGLRTSFNYVRNSVKATIDAYDGTVKLYKYDPNDPILIAYASAFPELFTPMSEMPDDIKAHVRYPLDLLRVQTAMWSRYHVDEANAFHDGLRWWAIAQEPGREVPKNQTADSTQTTSTAPPPKSQPQVSPYYVQMKLPGEDTLSWVAVRTFVPFAEKSSSAAADEANRRQNITAMMVAQNNADKPVKLHVYELPGDNPPAGPAIVAARINTVPEISKEITLLNAEGTTVRFGDMLTYPIENSFLYVLPLYVTGDEKADVVTTKVPALSKVIVAYGSSADQIAIGDSFSQALSKLFGQSFDDIFGAQPTTTPTTTPSTTPGGSTTLDPRVKQLANSIQARYADADAALKTGNLKRYAELQDEIKTLVDQLNTLVGK
jgi:uncharacterized membrane protein (UPF0182 family)